MNTGKSLQKYHKEKPSRRVQEVLMHAAKTYITKIYICEFKAIFLISEILIQEKSKLWDCKNSEKQESVLEHRRKKNTIAKRATL